MLKVTFRLPDRTETTVDVYPDMSVMEAALLGGIPHILGTCGGIRSCATCHVIVAEPWAKAAGQAGEEENELLEGVGGRKPGSRLGCQVKISDALDGIVVEVPLAG